MILTPTQAQAVHTAVQTLTDVSARPGLKLSFVVDSESSYARRVTLTEDAGGMVVVSSGSDPASACTEQYTGWRGFADAYGLTEGATSREINVTVGIRFWNDHAERAPYDGPPEPQMPREITVSTTRVTLRGTPEQFKGLRDDAAFYCHRDGPDECPPGLRRSAAATLKTVEAALALARSQS